MWLWFEGNERTSQKQQTEEAISVKDDILKERQGRQSGYSKVREIWRDQRGKALVWAILVGSYTEL